MLHVSCMYMHGKWIPHTTLCIQTELVQAWCTYHIFFTFSELHCSGEPKDMVS